MKSSSMKFNSTNSSPMKAMSIIFVLFVLALLIPAACAQITIDSFSTVPDKVLPGDDVTLTFDLRNVGREDIEDVTVSLDLSKVPFAPVGSSSERTLDEIRRRRHETVFFVIRALPDAQMQIYKIPLLITSEGVTTSSLIGVEVTANAHLIILTENGDILKTGEQGKVTLKFVNDGSTPIQFLKVRLMPFAGYEIISSPSVYIGDVDLGDFETEEFTIIPYVTDPKLALTLEYRDSGNKAFVESTLVPLNVYTPQEAQQLGLLKGTSYVPFIAGVVLLGAIVIFYLKKRKHKNAP